MNLLLIVIFFSLNWIGVYEKLVEPVGSIDIYDIKICPFYFEVDENYYEKYFDFSKKKSNIAGIKTYPSFKFSDKGSRNLGNSIDKNSTTDSNCFDLDFGVSEIDSIDDPIYFLETPISTRSISENSFQNFSKFP